MALIVTSIGVVIGRKEIGTSLVKRTDEDRLGGGGEGILVFLLQNGGMRPY